VTYDWLQARFGWVDAVLTGLLVVQLLVAPVFSSRRVARLRAERATDPAALTRFYRLGLVGAWSAFGYVVLVLALSPGVDAGSIGVCAPAGDGLDYFFTALFLVAVPLGGLRARRRTRLGRPPALPESIAALMPRTRTERRLAVAVSFTAGIVEEAIFRGLLITAGVSLLGLTVYLAAALSLALFVWGHRYQGRRGMIGVGYVGLILTLIYLVSGSLVLPTALHITFDLVALVLVPVVPRAQPSTPK
jgi:membrane protease YdiL (CAAX protease family)